MIHHALNLKMKIKYGIYIDFFILSNETSNKNFTDKYKTFIDEYEEEYKKIENQL